ncbi:hypothetical protein PISMIDRAFT_15701 [Pisolithus microcarpus 441]|uniref:Uncharacterized protein n=1 Tax=Pisolithus microcarpus 441 TaxID=765257 RepID=A0A0C9Z9N9_9AGAM|nr:hypothetical protein PISMIDRAFT_15701 [Pisolithus microcarpus 441]
MPPTAIIGGDSYSSYSWITQSYAAMSRTATPNASLPSSRSNSNATCHAPTQMPWTPSKTTTVSPGTETTSRLAIEAPPSKPTACDKILHAVKKEDPDTNSCDFPKIIMDKLHDHYTTMHLDSHSPALKLSHVTLEQFHITMDVLECCTRVIGKPCFAYLAEAKDLIIRWPSAIHEALINTVDSIFLQEVVVLNYPLNLVSVTLGHNTELKTTGGGRAVPDICVEFYSKGPIPKVAYPVICQISFTESSDDAFDVIESIVEANPSIQMAMLLDVKESLDFSRPSSQSETWKSLSQDLTPLSLQEFITASNLMGRATTFAELITVSHHVWCSIISVDYYIWLRDSTGALDIRATSERTAHGSMPGNTGMDAVQNMIVQGLDLIRKSLIAFCEDAMQVSMVMPSENWTSPGVTQCDGL